MTSLEYGPILHVINYGYIIDDFCQSIECSSFFVNDIQKRATFNTENEMILFKNHTNTCNKLYLKFLVLNFYD